MAQNYDDNAPAWGNQTDSDVAKIKNNFEALKSTFSGASQPPNPVAGMWWYDTTAHILKVRNEANNAWQSVWDLANNKPIIANNTLADFNAALKSPAAGTEGFRKLGTGATDACAGNDSRLGTVADGVITNYKLASYTQGTQYLLISADAEKQSSVNPYNWEKIREFEIIRGGSLTIYFEFCYPSAISSLEAYARIYRNGNPVGVEHSTTSGATFVPVWEGISGWSPFDRVQLYVRVQHVPDLSYRAIVRNFRLYTNTRLAFWENILL